MSNRFTFFLALFFVFLNLQASSQVVSTYAGTPYVDKLDGDGFNCTFQGPTGLAVDSNQNIYVADYWNHAIRKISPTGQVRTIATKTTVPDLNNPESVAVDSAGNVYYANHAGTFVGKITAAGVGTIFAGSTKSGFLDTSNSLAKFTWIAGIISDKSGALYVGDGSRVRKIDSGKVTTYAGSSYNVVLNGRRDSARFKMVRGLAFDTTGGIVVLETSMIRKISKSGYVSTLAGSGRNASVDGNDTAASFTFLTAVTVDARTNMVYVTEQNSDKIRSISPAGVVTTIAGGNLFCGMKNDTGTKAEFCTVAGIAVDSISNLYVGDMLNNVIRRIDTQMVVSTYVGNGDKDGISGIDAKNSSFASPTGAAVDDSGNLYIADRGNNQIRKVTPAGKVSVFCGSGLSGNQTGSPATSSFRFLGEMVYDPKKKMLYVVDAGDLRIRSVDLNGNSSYFVGSGSPSDQDGIGTAASINPKGYLCIDTSGNLYFTDNHDNLKKVSPTGVVSTMVRPNYFLGDAKGVAADKDGNIYVAMRLPSQRILKIDTAENVSIYVQDLFSTISAGLGCDSRMNIYYADINTDHIFIFNNGVQTGSIGYGFGYADGPWNAAKFRTPVSVVFDKNDSMYIVDQGNGLIRRTSQKPLPPTTTHVQSHLMQGAAVVSPNPNNGVFEIWWDEAISPNPATVTITNSLGKLVYSESFQSKKGTMHFDLSPLKLAPGLYFANVTGSKQFTGKFLIR